MDNHFKKLKSNLELTPYFQEKITQHHNSVRSIIEENDKIKNTKLIGSLQRKTRIYPGTSSVFDIDILVVMGSFGSWTTQGGITASSAMESLRLILKNSGRYKDFNLSKDDPVVAFNYSGDNIRVEIVPAYIDQIGHTSDGKKIGEIDRGYWVPKNGKWEIADYDYEADYVSNQNENSKGVLVPAIKMVKAIKNIHFPELNSFPLEILLSQIVPEIVRLVGNNIKDEDLLYIIFSLLEKTINTSIKIPNSKSDEIIIEEEIINRLKGRFRQIEKFIMSNKKLSLKENKVRNWKILFGDYFPSSV